MAAAASEGGCGFEGRVNILGEPAISVHPCEEAFDDPPPW